MATVNTYMSGYSLAAGGYLTITGAGTIGGTGLYAVTGSTVVNSGTMFSKSSGGIGAEFKGVGTYVTNLNFVAGGAGGAGAAGGQVGYGGGMGVYMAQGTVTNSATIMGAFGGTGGGGYYNFHGNGGEGGAGGLGGAGLELDSGSLTSSGTIAAGGGGAGGVGGLGAVNGGAGGDGGDGGTGVTLGTAVGVNSHAIAGGTGGNGGDGGYATGYTGGAGGDGGAGGAGVAIGAGGLSNTQTITGGSGGNGGNGANGHYAGAGSGGAGGNGGAGVVLASGSLGNSGAITAGSGGAGGVGFGAAGVTGDGVDVTVGGVVTNAGGGVISGRDGVADTGSGGATVTNAGTITGTHDSVEFTHAGDRLIAQTSAVFNGAIVGGGGTLELAGGTGSITGLGGNGTISGAVSARFGGFGSYQVDSGAVFSLNGADAIGAGRTLANGGALSVTPGAHFTITGLLTNSGEIDVGGAPGALFSGLEFSGHQTLSGGGTVSLGATGYISGLTAGDSLTNHDNTIEGGGLILGPLTLTNDGTIDNDVGRMRVDTGGTVINHGLVESAGTGTLLVRGVVIDSGGGGTVTDGKRLRLDNGTLRGGALTIDKGAILISFLDTGTVDLLGGTVMNGGFIDGAAGGLTIDGDVANTGYVQADKGDLTITGSVTGTGRARVFGAGVLEVDGALGQTAVFTAGSSGTLVLGAAGPFAIRVRGFNDNTTLDLKAFASGSYSLDYNPPTATGVTLKIVDIATTAVAATIRLAGDYTGSTFTLAPDGSGGSMITDPPKVTTLTAAMAAFGAAGGTSPSAAASWSATPAPLAAPH